ncbi:MAG: DUF1398 domain-containing protein [Chitinophagaceae bacterium]|nr:MAG: DUF1398 domain-containing protein [Chitinophagaceae bacterium]
MQKLTSQQVREAEIRSSGQPFASYIKNLHQLGVDRYEVSLANGERKFTYSINQELVIPGNSTVRRHCSDVFELSAVAAAIARNKEGLTDYGKFLDEIAHAGVHTYTADVAGKQVIYNGKKVSEVYAEPIPSMDNE